MHRYTPKEIRFLERNITGRGMAELTELFNRRFGLAQTKAAICRAASHHGLTNGMELHHKYTPAQIRFLEKKVAGRDFSELTELFNRHFRLSLASGQIRNACHNRGLYTGRDTRFRPGTVPFNKGKKGCCPAGSETGWFKPDHIPANKKPVGTERINADGYVEIRIRNPTGKLRRNWKAKHRIIWEKANGKIPRGHVVLFADGNKSNFALDNLILVSRSELAVMNRRGLISNNTEFTKTGKIIADVKIRIADRKRKTKKNNKSRIHRRKTNVGQN